MKQEITIGIAEDHVMVRQGLISLLKEFDGFNVIFDVNNGQELIEELALRKADIILLDIDMPVMGGKEALAIIRERFPDVKVIIISMHFDNLHISEFIKNGANSFLQKSCYFEELFTAINSVYEYGRYYNESVSRALAKEFTGQNSKRPNAQEIKFTKRELEILTLIQNQKTNEEIATMLCISSRTVEWHRSNLIHKTGSKHTQDLIQWANQNLSTI